MISDKGKALFAKLELQAKYERLSELDRKAKARAKRKARAKERARARAFKFLLQDSRESPLNQEIQINLKPFSMQRGGYQGKAPRFKRGA